MTLDALVIGAGQAGLAAGNELACRGRSYLIVDRASEVGESWLSRYRSLTLFTPRQFSALPGLVLPGDPQGYATRVEFAAYLQTYAERLQVRLNAGVERLQLVDGQFQATLAGGERIAARNVVIATGGFQRPVVPSFASALQVAQRTAETYHEPASVPAGTILVVGDGASGRDIAAELAVAGRKTLLATGKPRRLFPERLLGRSIWWWLDLLGALRASPNSWIGRKMRAADAFPDRGRSITKLRELGVEIVPRVTGGSGNEVSFSDAARRHLDGVVWCIGYRDDTSWIDIPGTVSNGSFLHSEGISPIAGVFFVGRPWQRNRASGLIMGVGADAAELVKRLA